MSRIAYPFLTIPDELVTTDDWLISGVGEEAPLQRYLENWDYNTEINLRREISIEVPELAQAVQVPEESLDLFLLVRIGTGPGSKPRKWIYQERLSTETGTFKFSTSVESKTLSTRLYLETSLVLAKSTDKGAPISPMRQGSRLWSDVLDVMLEGEEPRFPIELAKFSGVFNGAYISLPWMLHWSPANLHRDFGSAVRLFINSEAEDFCQRFVDGDTITLHSVMSGVVQQICVALISQYSDEELAECDEGSLGGYAMYWLSLAFPSDSLDQIRSKLDSTPGSVYASLATAAEIGEVE